jgi:hypothetical protein
MQNGRITPPRSTWTRPTPRTQLGGHSPWQQTNPLVKSGRGLTQVRSGGMPSSSWPGHREASPTRWHQWRRQPYKEPITTSSATMEHRAKLNSERMEREMRRRVQARGWRRRRRPATTTGRPAAGGGGGEGELTGVAALSRNPNRLPCRPSMDDAGALRSQSRAD